MEDKEDKVEDKGVIITFGRRQQFQTLVSENQVERLKDKILHMTQCGYVRVVDDGKSILLSHFIAGNPPPGYVKDHINRNRADNRNSNLRNATPSENAQNKPKRANCTSSLKGVTKHGNKWVAEARKLEQRFRVSFDSEIEAAKCYDRFVWRLHSESMTRDLTNNLLTDDEIEIAKITNPPLSAIKLKRFTVLKGVRRDGNAYRVQLRNENGTLEYFGRFQFLDEANKKVTEARARIDAAKKAKLENLPISKNEMGQAYIIAGKTTIHPHDILVDEDSWHKINQYSWYVNSNGYVVGTVSKKLIYLHRFIWDKVHGLEPVAENCVVDHVNQNKKDCRLQNLRILSKSENSHNRKKRKNCAPTMVGAHFKTRGKKWHSYCKKKYLGQFDSEKEAAEAYKVAAKQAFPNCYK